MRSISRAEKQKWLQVNYLEGQRVLKVRFSFIPRLEKFVVTLEIGIIHFSADGWEK